MTIDPSLLRILWTEIEIIPNHVVCTLSDTALTTIVIQQVAQQVQMSGLEWQQLSSYLGEKLSLIRDMADFRTPKKSPIVA